MSDLTDSSGPRHDAVRRAAEKPPAEGGGSEMVEDRDGQEADETIAQDEAITPEPIDLRDEDTSTSPAPPKPPTEKHGPTRTFGGVLSVASTFRLMLRGLTA